jgi:hemoglobin
MTIQPELGHDAPEHCPIADSEKARTLPSEGAPAPARTPPAVRVAAPSVASRTATANAPSAPPNPHFELIGGAAGIERLVEHFYGYMDTLPEAASIRAMHPADLAPVKAVLVRFLIEWTGGPQGYSQVHGRPRLRRMHLPFSIGAAERDAWMACMTRALTDTTTDAELREQLIKAFFRTADFLRNDKGAPHDQHRNHAAREP